MFFHPTLIMLILVQQTALLQMAPVLEVSPSVLAGGADDFFWSGLVTMSAVSVF